MFVKLPTHPSSVTFTMKVEPYEADNAGAATNTLSSIGTMLSPLATSLQLYGLYVPRERKGFVKKLQWFYGCLLATIFWGNIIRISCVFLREKGVSARLTLSASIFIMVLGSSYLHSASLYAFSKHLDTFQSMMTSYHEKYVFSFKPAHVKRILRYMCILISVASTGITGGICYIAATPGTIASTFVNPFDDGSPGMRIACLSLLGIIFFLLFANGFSNIIYFLIVCYCLGKEFDAFNTAVQNMITQKCLEEKLETFRMRHTQLCRLTAQANKMTKHLLFTILTMAIPVFCFVLFGIVRGSIGVEDLLASVLMLMIGVAILLFTLIPACILNIKVILFILFK